MLGPDALRDVGTLHEDACDDAGLVPNRLVDVVDEPLFRRCIWSSLQVYALGEPICRLACVEHFVEEFVAPLTRKLREGLDNRLPDDISTADQVRIDRIDELEAMIFSAEYCHERRSLLEKALETLELFPVP